MKVLILNSGLGKRMGVYTEDQPKCMSRISETETILSRQLKLLASIDTDITEIVMTTGPFVDILEKYVESLGLPLKYTFVNNPLYASTNYIYSIYLAKKYLCDDILLMHGDLVFDENILKKIIEFNGSCMTVSSTLSLPEKDFKAVIKDGHIVKVGIEFFDNAQAAQPLYKLLKKDWQIWLDRICDFCEDENVKCYAENAFNEISDECIVYPLDVKNELCNEVDTIEDLEVIKHIVDGEYNE